MQENETFATSRKRGPQKTLTGDGKMTPIGWMDFFFEWMFAGVSAGRQLDFTSMACMGTFCRLLGSGERQALWRRRR